MDKKPFERLPQNVLPKQYDMIIKPNLEEFTFEGEETVSLMVQEQTSFIILNAIELSIASISFSAKDGEDVPCISTELSEENETATFKFASDLPLGPGLLTIKFSGTLNDKMKGFYRTKYLTPSGQTRYGAATQFEATAARYAFPCWDEPALKAIFNVTLVAPKDLVTLSNMNVVSEKISASDEKLKEVKFATTPVMSTYLLAFIIGEYEFVEDVTTDGLPVRVYTPVGKAEQGVFALHVATKVMPYYREYFQVEYPLPKLDLIAVSELAIGAMENWGLVTFLESCLLVDPQNSSTYVKQNVVLIIGHELAHMWFGNIVTMEWWTHLWLKEGFASWIEFLCVNFIFPEYKIWTQFVSVFIVAMELDALKNSHPIEVPVGHPSEVDQIFDSISYNKGSCIIHMLHDYIGDTDFRKGMNIYLTKHKYGNAFTEDLWDALETATNKPIRAVMSTWTRQMGYPLVKVNILGEGSTKTISLTQERFVADGHCDGDSSIWAVPITLSIGPKKTRTMLLDSKSSEIVIDDVQADEWIKLNPGNIGYYRCQYSSETLQSFLPAIQDNSMSALDRLGLQCDLFALVISGQISTVEFLKFLEAFVNEVDYTVWSSISSSLSKICALLSYTDYMDLFKKYGQKLMVKIASHLGWDEKAEEGHLDTLLRTVVLQWMGSFGDAATITEAKTRFEAHVNKTHILPPDLRLPVYQTVMSVGDEGIFDSLLKLYREVDLNEEKRRLSRALGAAKEQKLLQRALEFAMSDEVRTQDAVVILTSVSRNRHGRELAWLFFKENWTVLKKRYGGGYLMNSLIKSSTEDFASEEKVKEVEIFFKEHPMEGTERALQQSLENIRLNERWLSRDSAAIKTFLVDHH